MPDNCSPSADRVDDSGDHVGVLPGSAHRLESPCGRVAIEYHWSGDRFVHRVLIDGRVCLTSVDGDGSQAWPASPPIQQISLEPIQDVPMILGVGAAGRGHWSISVGWQADSASDEQNSDEQNGDEQNRGDQKCDHQNGGEFRFDIACRVKDTPEYLGSTYTPHPDPDKTNPVGAENAVKEVMENRELKISVVVGKMSQSDQKIAISAAIDDTNETYRWVYSLRV